MEVAKDVLAASGQRLLAQGTVLGARLISILADRGIAAVDIQQEQDATRQISKEERTQIELQTMAWLQERYRLAAQNEPLTLLRPVFLKWLVARKLL
jgi:hypothetical protein